MMLPPPSFYLGHGVWCYPSVPQHRTELSGLLIFCCISYNSISELSCLFLLLNVVFCFFIQVNYTTVDSTGCLINLVHQAAGWTGFYLAFLKSIEIKATLLRFLFITVLLFTSSCLSVIWNPNKVNWFVVVTWENIKGLRRKNISASQYISFISKLPTFYD